MSSNTQPTPPTPLRLIAYTRVSTDWQVANGDSPAAQEEAIRAWTAAAGHAVTEAMADNGLSGTLAAEDRPALTAALVAIADGEADGLVILSLDRLARELHVQEAVLARAWTAGGRVFESTRGEVLQDDPNDPMRRFLRQVMGAASELEAATIRMRMRQGRTRKAQRGGFIGGAPFRPRYGHELVRGEDGTHAWQPVPAQQPVIDQIVAGRLAGLSTRAIAAELNAAGIAPPAGRQWYHSAVQRVTRAYERAAVAA